MAPTINGIGLVVADMATSLSFYRRLGLDIPAEAENEPHAEVELPGGIRLMFDTEALMASIELASPGKQGAAEKTKTGPSLAFLCSDPAEVDATHADLVGAGYRSYREPWDAEWGQRYAVIHDPDGYTVDLFAWFKN
ncbi:VOC family protein [Paractinoplanes toevensis]|uniref:Glyoxalase n=1 Tax=Paractinoplanes toevensis TaxID=571911 RepID=A0A919T799_9ACTN|nr:VOC family protein [Actinoplanes toevensis]GIM89371.1 glyoxalase [Actinoplanes toevensis]